MSNTSKTNTTMMWSTVVPDTHRSDRGDIRRCWDPTADPALGMHGCRTLYEAFRRGAALNPLGPCMGFRAVSASGFATPYIYSSYRECLARIEAMAAGLHVMQLCPPNSEGYKCLGLYLQNCMEWSLAEHATYTIGGTTVPFYDTLGPDTVTFILAQTDTKTVVCARAELDKLCQVKKTGKTPNFQAVILVDGVTAHAAQAGKDAGLDICSMAKVEAVGAHRMATAKNNSHDDKRAFCQPPSPRDVATFSYTSGTTGDPKGALLTHENLLSTASGMASIMPEMEMQPTDRHLSYLPLAHIFERVVINQVFGSGGSAAYFRGDPLLLVEDLQACRPTLLPVAPRVLNKIYDKIFAGVVSAGGLKKKIFDAAVAAKTEGLKHGYMTHALYDRLVFNKIKVGLGLDQLRFVVSGSAPLADNVMMFFRLLLGVPVVEGYGQTEGAAAATVSHPDDVATAGHVGGPTGSTEIVLMDVPEMNYLHTDTTHRGQPCEGRGEICVRGPNVFKGYYKDEAKTRETIDEEGWLHSGDIGLWRPDGTLQIIDRKKNIFKLSQGEYVAPEKIENVLARSSLIAQCFVYGDSLQSCLVAVVVPNPEPVQSWVASSGARELEGATFADICRSKALNAAVMEDIRRLSKECGLNGFETPKAVYLESSPFTLEGDLLTPTFKLKRQQARDKYRAEIDRLYAALPPPRSKL